MTTTTAEQEGGPLTFEKVWAALMENRQQMKEMSKEADRRGDALDRRIEETARQMKMTDKRFGELSNRFGDMVESMVLPNLMARFNDLHYAFKEAASRKEIEDDEHGIYLEIDAYLENTECAMAVETKVKPNQNDVDTHIKRMEKLRAYADLNAINRRYYGGMAGVVMSKEVKAYILAHGLYAIEPAGETFTITVPEGPGAPRAW